MIREETEFMLVSKNVGRSIFSGLPDSELRTYLSDAFSLLSSMTQESRLGLFYTYMIKEMFCLLTGAESHAK